MIRHHSSQRVCSTRLTCNRFAYFKLYLSVALVLKSFRMTVPSSTTFVPSKWARLPERLEWVAAVPVVDMSGFSYGESRALFYCKSDWHKLTYKE